MKNRIKIQKILASALLSLSVIPLWANNNYSLNGTWQFALNAPGNYQPMPVPSCWTVQGLEEPVYRGFKDDQASTGYYRYIFRGKKEWEGQRALLHFGGVWQSAEVTLNGRFLGRHDCGYTSFAYDVTGLLKDRDTLEVKVQQVSPNYKLDVYDDWTLPGIYRDVELEFMPLKRWIDYVTVRTTFDSRYEDADLNMHIMVADKNKGTTPGNYPIAGEPYQLRLRLSDAEGTLVQERTMDVPSHSNTDREHNVTMHILKPNPWNAESPYLYRLDVDLIEGGKEAHQRTVAVGFRQIETAGGVFRINGQAVKLRGVNRHDEHPDVGRATRREHWLQDIQMMKAANINYIRCSHYTPARGFIELCDSLGIYLGDECSIGGGPDYHHNPSNTSGALERAEETVSENINSPSIVYWSIGNESPLSTIGLKTVKLVKALDPTRPTLLPWLFEEWLPEEVDLLSIHYWHAQEYDRFGGNARRPYISTEFTHAFGNEGLGGLNDRWRAIVRHTAGAGAAIWMWADQGIHTPTVKPAVKVDLSGGDDHLRIDYAGWDGIVDSYRRPTQDYWEAKAVYSPVYPNVSTVTYTDGQARLQIPIQNDYDFTDLNTVKVKWQICREGETLDSGEETISGEPHSAHFLYVPATSLKAMDPACHYLQLTFIGKEGTELTSRDVEILPRNPQPVVLAPKGEIQLTESASKLSLSIAGAEYCFYEAKGQLAKVMVHGQELLSEVRPIIWRPFDICESSGIGKANCRINVDYGQYSAKVENWTVSRLRDSVQIAAKVDYQVNDSNRFTVDYLYTLTNDGRLKVHYSILTDIQLSLIPVSGMQLEVNPSMTDLHWFGLGPYDAYPNRKLSGLLGIWGGSIQDDSTMGNKSVRRIECRSAKMGFRILGSNYLEHTSSAPYNLHILGDVLARPEKGRLADESMNQMLTGTGSPFVGEFIIEPFSQK